MVRKAPATTKNKGSNSNETSMAGITEHTDILQQLGNPAGIALDQSVAKAAKQMTAEKFADMPGGLNSEIYGVPSGVQLTENINEEIAEAVETKTEEKSIEKE